MYCFTFSARRKLSGCFGCRVVINASTAQLTLLLRYELTVFIQRRQLFYRRYSLDDMIDDAVFLGFLSIHPFVALHILMDALQRLAGVACHY